jgi:addiction module RelE/StbE family toxin
MWKVFEGPRARKSLAKLPQELLKKYEKWKDIVAVSGPVGLRAIRGFHDEALRGEWFGFRSLRLSIQYRIIYRIIRDECWVDVINVNAHDHRR